MLITFLAAQVVIVAIPSEAREDMRIVQDLSFTPAQRPSGHLEERNKQIDTLVDRLRSTTSLVSKMLPPSYLVVHIKKDGAVAANGRLVEIRQLNELIGLYGGLVDSVEIEIFFTAEKPSRTRNTCSKVLRELYVPGVKLYYASTGMRMMVD